MGHAPEEEVLVLRAPKRHSNSIAEYQEYEEDEATIALRQQMTDINAWLDTADITCSHPQVDPAQRRLRRIFNNSDFAQGGRLYGGFWQAMSSDERQEHILIEGDCCVELDYGQMSLAILYGCWANPHQRVTCMTCQRKAFRQTTARASRQSSKLSSTAVRYPRRCPRVSESSYLQGTTSKTSSRLWRESIQQSTHR